MKLSLKREEPYTVTLSRPQWLRLQYAADMVSESPIASGLDFTRGERVSKRITQLLFVPPTKSAPPEASLTLAGTGWIAFTNTFAKAAWLWVKLPLAKEAFEAVLQQLTGTAPAAASSAEESAA